MGLENPIRDIWSRGDMVINGWLGIASSFSAEIMAAQGYDSLTIDMQHGIVDYQAMVTMLQALRAAKTGALVRVPWLEPGIVMKSLDAGAHGVICPMINNREEASRLVSFMRYPPLGTRSFGPTRALVAHGSDYFSTANQQVLCIAMVETAAAMENLQEIVTTPGLDGVYIGPADLSLGISDGRLSPGLDIGEPELVTAIQRIIGTAHDAGIKVGLHTGGPADAAKTAGWGIDLVTVGNDTRLLAAAARRAADETRRHSGQPEKAADKGELY